MGGETLDVSWRMKQLLKLRRAVESHEKELTDALTADLGRSYAEGYFCDVGTVILEINEILRGLKQWARPEKHFSGLLCWPSISTKVGFSLIRPLRKGLNTFSFLLSIPYTPI